MKSELAQKLREILENKTQEQMNQEWAAIKALNLEGPSMDDIVEYFSTIQEQFGSYKMKAIHQTDCPAGEINYAIAA